VTVALKLRNAEQIEQRIEQLYTRGSPTYRQFITPEQFREQFAPDAATVAAVSRAFAVQGLSVTQAATAQLHVSGSAALAYVKDPRAPALAFVRTLTHRRCAADALTKNQAALNKGDGQ
jgi:Pro-kumamolisin, activation domain